MPCTYDNLYASGLAGSDVTTTNPPHPSTISTTVTTHNQPQHDQFITDTATTAALQNHRDDVPNLADNEAACLCSSCHLRDRFFPRSQDGRIVLPHPSLFTREEHLPWPTGPTPSATPSATPALVTRRTRIDSTASNCDPKFNEGRRGGRSRTLSDKCEGSSTGAGQLSVLAIEESWMTLSDRSSRETTSTDESQRESGGRSFAGPSRRAQKSKKYDQRPNPWPRILESDEFAVHLTQRSSSTQHSLDKSRRTRLESLLDRRKTQPPDLFQAFRVPELSPQMAKLETPRPTTPPQSHVSAYGYEHNPNPSSVHHGEPGVNASMCISSFPETPDRLEISHHRRRQRQRHYSTSRPKSPVGVATHSSHPEYPQPANNNSTTTTTSVDKTNHSSPMTQPTSSSHQHHHQLHFERNNNNNSSSSFQTQFRFQEPVVPKQPHITIPTTTTTPELVSVVQVKWDSERKRRQGYFAQEEGAEKSPFRHYNKANCDFES